MKIDFEKIILVFFFGLMLYISCSALFQQKLSHDYPVGYMASDTFQHQVRVESIKDMGNYRYEAPYIAAGFTDVVGFYPPVMYHVSAIFSQLSSLESYDAAYLMVIFFTILSAFVMYYLIRRLNKNVAIMSLPLMLLVFTGNFFSGITWGQWPFFMGSFFLLCSIWVLTHIKLSKSYIFLGLFLSATFLTHTSEFIFGAIFIMIYLLIIFLMKKITMVDIRKVILSGIILLILISYFMIIFQATWMKSEAYRFKIEPSITNFRNMHLTDFSWTLPLIIIGILLMFPVFYKRSEPVLLFGAFMLLAGFTNYIGFGMRAFQTRFLWPVYLAIFSGLTLQQALKFVIKNKAALYVPVSVLLMLLLVFGIPGLPAIKGFYEPSTGSIMNSYHWQAIEWIRSGTNKDDNVFFFYSPMFHGQTSLDYNTKRKNYLIDYAEVERDSDVGVISRNYSSWIPFDGGAALPHRTGFFSFGYYTKEKNLTYFEDICSYNYYVFDRTVSNAKTIGYHTLVVSRFLNNGMSVAFNNDVVLILKNNNLGGDCIAG